MHSTAAILSTGDELVLGQLLDTNARWIAQRLTDRGVRVTEVAIVGDEMADLAGAITRLAASHDVLIVSGGLGPTDGDLTRHAICQVTGDALVFDQAEADALTAKLAKRGRTVNEKQLRQAHRPSRAACLPNAHGTAPGLSVRIGACDALCLPGPPNELHPMWNASVEPALMPVRSVVTRLLYAVGLPEADCAAKLVGLTVRDRVPLVGMTASGGVITIRMRYEGADAAAGAGLLDRDEAEIHTRLSGHIVASRPGGAVPSDEVLAGAVLDALKARGQTLALAESCTGGMVGELLTRISGSSGALVGGVISYSNAIKSSLLGVPAADLEAQGAVSEAVAAAMARGACLALQAEWAIAITGVAGPDGGSEAKPVGTVWIGIASRAGQVDTRRFVFPGTRADVRTRATLSALTMLCFAVTDSEMPALLWQMR